MYYRRDATSRQNQLEILCQILYLTPEAKVPLDEALLFKPCKASNVVQAIGISSCKRSSDKHSFVDVRSEAMETPKDARAPGDFVLVEVSKRIGEGYVLWVVRELFRMLVLAVVVPLGFQIIVGVVSSILTSVHLLDLIDFRRHSSIHAHSESRPSEKRHKTTLDNARKRRRLSRNVKHCTKTRTTIITEIFVTAAAPPTYVFP